MYIFGMWLLTGATLMGELGESIETAQAILGHSDLETTLNPHMHVIPDLPSSWSRGFIPRCSQIGIEGALSTGDGDRGGSPATGHKFSVSFGFPQGVQRGLSKRRVHPLKS